MRLAAEEDGLRLRARREQLGVTQAQLAELVDVTQTSISLIEIGRRTPRDHVKARIAMALGCDIATIWQPPTRAHLVKMTKAS